MSVNRGDAKPDQMSILYIILVVLMQSSSLASLQKRGVTTEEDRMKTSNLSQVSVIISPYRPHKVRHVASSQSISSTKSLLQQGRQSICSLIRTKTRQTPEQI